MRRAHLTLIGLGLAAMLTACGSPPRRELPPLPETWFTGADGGARNVDAQSLANWWHAFDDPLLSGLIGTALARNLDVQAALAELRVARAQLRLSQAALLPRVDLAGQGSRQWIEVEELAESDAGRLLGVDDRLRVETWQLALQADWEIDLFGANRLRSQAAAQQLGSVQAQLVATRLAVASNLAQGYVQARALQAQRALLAQDLRIASELVRVAEGMFSLGEVTRLDVEAAAAEHAAMQTRLGDIEAGLAEAAFALDTLTDQPPGSVLAMLAEEGDIPQVSGPIPAGQPLDLLRRRPDVIAAAAALDAAGIAALAARRDLFPQLGLSAAAGRSGVGVESISSASDLRSLALQLSFPWLDFGAPRARIAQADAEADAGFIALRQAIAGAIEEVEVANARVGARRRQLAAGHEALERAERAHHMARRTYELGLANLGDVLDAQAGLVQVRRQVLDSERALAIAQIDLYTALGGGWDARLDVADRLDAVRGALQDDPVPDRTRTGN